MLSYANANPLLCLMNTVIVDRLIKAFGLGTGSKKYLVNTSWLFLEQAARMVIGLFISIWIIRYLGPDRYGILSYAQSWVVLLGGSGYAGRRPDSGARIGTEAVLPRHPAGHLLRPQTGRSHGGNAHSFGSGAGGRHRTHHSPAGADYCRGYAVQEWRRYWAVVRVGGAARSTPCSLTCWPSRC